MRRWRRSSAASPPSGSPPSWTSCCSARTRSAGIDLMVETGLGEVVLPEIGAMRMAIDEHHQHKDVYQHSLTVLRQAIGLEERRAPIWCCAGRRCCTTSASPPTRRHEPDGGVSFHHHEVVGAKMTRKRMRALKYSKQMVDDVSQLVYLHLRFHGYGDGQVDRLGGAPLRHRRGPAAAAAAQAGARRLHHPQQAPRGAAAGQLRRPGGPDRRAGRQGGPAAGAAGPRRQRDHARSSTSRRARRSARRGAISRSCGWTAGRSTTTRRSPNS